MNAVVYSMIYYYYMKEMDVSPSSVGDCGSWDMTAVAGALQTASAAVTDGAFAAGRCFQAGSATVEVFPAAGVVRIAAAGARLELFRQDPPQVRPDQIAFERDDCFVSISASGEVVLLIGTATAVVEASHPPAAAAKRSEMPPAVETPVLDHPGASETLSSDGSHAPRAAGDKDPRVALIGRVARQPWIGETPKQRKPIAKFPLAVRCVDEPEKTTYHDIVAFDEKVEQVKPLRKGQSVEVVGYAHPTQRRTKTGELQEGVEIRVAAIRDRSGGQAHPA